ncbi:MAG: hypothetical protein KF862_03300 [Chitinophagaceae bacterium]|nr:hypothetical protein [Chitinophagaceae bacterium]
MKVFRFFISLAVFIVLTILTQVGGIIYLLSLLISSQLNKRIDSWWARTGAKTGIFLLVYIICSWLIIPPTAKSYGKIPLPVFENNHLKPLTILTPLLNRHYIREDVKTAVTNAATALNKKFPGSVVNYLDAGFPFINGFPLLPHLSHHDGKKLDIAFRYTNSKTGGPVNGSPSWLGYGICEEPLPGEINTTVYCQMKGYRQYSALQRYIPQENKANYKLDEEQTKALIRNLAAEKKIEKIFIEPHLQTRMNLSDNKIRFHGCHSVRHDDHIHIEVK